MSSDKSSSESPRDAVLAAVFKAYPLEVSLVESFEYCGHWFENEPPTPQGSFHLIDRGRCWVHSAHLREPLQLQAGDLVVFPRGSAHTLQARRADEAPQPDLYSTLICGAFRFSSERQNPLLRALPEAFVVRADSGGPAFRELAQVLASSARRPLPGQQALLNKLADSLFVMAVCVYAAQAAGDGAGLLAALADPRLAKALAAIHMQPGTAWRVDTLARVAGMSRTAFSVEFTRRLGLSPFQYLTECRIAEARRLLADRRLSVAAIAEQLGYQSEAAFRRTFKRIEGVGPGQLRRAAA
ncbi:AraC family transcriptional regulator [Solimonas soli]|uniref:AraC family transcriptional regulator n=1 Tax=Solimonas soli TaxID=413479 RepID=UPI0004824283|nr:AraC family transcriptional regulator [Solimonas soli]